MNNLRDIISSIRDLSARVRTLEGSNQLQRIAAPIIANPVITANGNTIIDINGINSLANFPSKQIFNGQAGLTTTSDIFIDVPGSTMSPIELSRGTKILFTVMGYGYNTENIITNGSSRVALELCDASTGSLLSFALNGHTTTYVYEEGTPPVTMFTMTVGNEMISTSAIIELPEGSHTFSLRYKVVGTGEAHLNAWSIGYIFLGS